MSLFASARSADTMSLFVVSGPGLEDMLAHEIAGLGVGPEDLSKVPGGVEVNADLTLLYKLNLELGLALKVLLRMDEFPVRRFDALVKRCAALRWEEWIDEDATLSVKATCKRSKLYHSGAVVERVIAGISERLGRSVKLASDADPSAISVQARLVGDVCTLSLDTSGELLHRRGYRHNAGKAPLREDLARALILASGWDRQSPLCDPFAGAGTIAIEADWLSRGVAPGKLRRFSFMDAPNFDDGLWQTLRRRAVAREQRNGPPIWASDRDAGAVAAIRENAERARATTLHVEHAALSAASFFTAAPGSSGVIVTNPPYGKRVSQGALLSNLYRAFGARVRSMPGSWGVAIAVAEPDHARATELPLRPALMTDHGGSKIYFSVCPDVRVGRHVTRTSQSA